MKFTPFIAAAILAYGASADEAQKPIADESSPEAATSSVNSALPTFTVSEQQTNHPVTRPALTFPSSAHYPQGPLPRAIHR